MTKRKIIHHEEKHELLFRNPYIWIITFTVTTLNFIITYDLRTISVNFIYFYLVDLLTTYFTLRFYKWGINILNKKFPIKEDFFKRGLYQLTLHTLSVTLLNIILNEFFDFVFFQSSRLSLSFEYYTQDIFLALFFILFFQVLYFGLFLLSDKQNVKHVDSDKKIKVHLSDGFKILNLSDIFCIYSYIGIIYVTDKSYNRYITSNKLKDFENVDSDILFRANRKVIFTKPAIDSYKSSENGKIEVFIKTSEVEDIPMPVIISRDKASSFRRWISKEFIYD